MRCSRFVITALSGCLVLAVWMALSGCRGNDAAGANRNLLSITESGTQGVKVKPLDDPGSPYRGKYEEWDKWIYTHARSAPTAWKNGEGPNGETTLTGRVNADGYLIPTVEYARLFEKSRCDGISERFLHSFSYIYGEGVPQDPSMVDRQLAAEWSVRSQYYPRIPDWVAASPPRVLMLPPNGDVLMQGKPGSGADGKNLFCCGNDKWYRYGEAGNLLGQASVWWLLYFDVKKNPRPDGDMTNREDGYFYFTDSVTGTILSLWDYDGTRLSSNQLPPWRDVHNFIFLRPGHIKAIWEAQNKSGKWQNHPSWTDMQEGGS